MTTPAELARRLTQCPYGCSGLAWDDRTQGCAACGFVAELHIVFDGPPGPEAGRFVEVEDAQGRSINAGAWRQRADGYWELVING